MSDLLSILKLLILLQVHKFYLVYDDATMDVQKPFDSIREAVKSITGTGKASIALA
jgi:hypothetical protein